jgi:hypothetical protein
MRKLFKVFFNLSFKDSLLNLAYILMAGMLLSCTNGKSNEVLTVGEHGNLNCIVIPDHSEQEVKFAASELQFYLKKITGQDLRIVESSYKIKGESAIQLFLEKDKELKWDGYKIKTSYNDIGLVSGEPRGLLYAVYTLLEKSGCSFFYPGEREEIVVMARPMAQSGKRFGKNFFRN